MFSGRFGDRIPPDSNQLPFGWPFTGGLVGRYKIDDLLILPWYCWWLKSGDQHGKLPTSWSVRRRFLIIARAGWFEWSHFCCDFRGTYRWACGFLVLMRAGWSRLSGSYNSLVPTIYRSISLVVGNSLPKSHSSGFSSCVLTGVIKFFNIGRMKQCNSMVIYSDLPLKVLCWGWCHYNDPCFDVFFWSITKTKYL